MHNILDSRSHLQCENESESWTAVQLVVGARISCNLQLKRICHQIPWKICPAVRWQWSQTRHITSKRPNITNSEHSQCKRLSKIGNVENAEHRKNLASQSKFVRPNSNFPPEFRLQWKNSLMYISILPLLHCAHRRSASQAAVILLKTFHCVPMCPYGHNNSNANH